eukprot:11338765-Alexandrium_andersonii.AAC.1
MRGACAAASAGVGCSRGVRWSICQMRCSGSSLRAIVGADALRPRELGTAVAAVVAPPPWCLNSVIVTLLVFARRR